MTETGEQRRGEGRNIQGQQEKSQHHNEQYQLLMDSFLMWAFSFSDGFSTTAVGPSLFKLEGFGCLDT